MNEKWYGFDIDGTIADNSAHTFGMGKIGKPVKPMCDLMKKLHAEGRRVKICTARLSDVGSDPSSQQAVKEHIWKWCDENLGFRPEITDRKDYEMECLYDDRAKQVVRNTGECLEDLYNKLVEEVRAKGSADGDNPRDAGKDRLRTITAEESAIIGADDEVIENILKSRSNLDRVRGCLFGGAVGDALGYPVEFMGESQIFAHFGKNGICGYELDPKTGKALISDDTQMTLFTATGILVGNTRGNLRGIMGPLWSYAAQHYEDWIRTQEVSLNERKAELRGEKEDSGFRFQHSWLVNEPRLYHHRAPGTTCLSGIRTRLGDWPHGAPSGFPINNSKGCGGVMRVAPFGLFLSNLDRERIDDSHAMEITDRQAAEAAAFTHSNSLGYMPAAVLAHIVNRLVYPLKVKRKPMPVKDAVCEARDAARRLFADDKHIGELVALIDRAITLAEGSKKDIDCIHELGEGWVGDEALAIAIFCALRHHNDFSAGIIAAVNHRGDSDSTGAITGNILGAHLGYAAIDGKWKKDLELSDVILELSGDLCRKCQMHERGPKYDSVWMSKYGCAVPDYVVPASLSSTSGV